VGFYGSLMAIYSNYQGFRVEIGDCCFFIEDFQQLFYVDSIADEKNPARLFIYCIVIYVRLTGFLYRQSSRIAVKSHFELV